MNRILQTIFTLSLILALSQNAVSGQLDAQLADELRGKTADELVSVWIEYESDHDSRALKASVTATYATRAQRHAQALASLKQNARAQEELLAQLNSLQTQGRAHRIKSHWLVNVIEAQLPAGELETLAERDDIVAIYSEPVVELIGPTSNIGPEATPANVTGTGDNLRHINAHTAHFAGYTGVGRLICSFDTGVNGGHPALQPNWKGNDGDSAAAWFDPVARESFPHVVNSSLSPAHGTHTLGIIVGVDGADTIGVAPAAKWIAAAVIDIAGASILDAFEWAADPDGNPNTVADVPDVISHSWGFRFVRCANIFYDAIDATEALGIVNIFAAGNEGGALDAIRNPADRANDMLDCFAIGNINHVSDIIATNSSRGPSPCDQVSIKPNVIAPGVDIRSAYAYSSSYTTLSGTSQAAPHVAGLVAMLRQAKPNATVNEIKTAIITTTRTSGAWGAIPNYLYGWGEIDCWAAIQAIVALPNSVPNLRVYDFNYPAVAPGGTAIGRVILQNRGDSAFNVTATVVNSNPALTIIDGFLSFGNIGQGDTLSSMDEITVTISDTVPVGTVVSADLAISGSGLSDTVRIHFLTGPQPGKSVATHVGSRIQFSLSDYGVLGLGSGSIFPLNGSGFVFDSTTNDLWEGGIMVGTGYSRVSSGVHSLIFDPDMDFKAVPGGDIELINPGPIAAEQTFAKFDDRQADSPLGLEITQESYLYGSPNDDFVVLRYILQNRSGNTLSNLYFGLFIDFDLGIAYDRNAGGYESTGEYVWMAYNDYLGELSRFRGVKLLTGPLAAAGAIDYATYLHWPPTGGSANGLTTDEKFGALTSGLLHADTNKTSQEDLYIVVSAGPLTLADEALDTVQFALLAGNTQLELADAARRSQRVPTDVEQPGEGQTNLPSSIVLHQNYPNPFNPSTTITFDMPRRSEYRLEVINMLGQTIFEQVAVASAGRVGITWDGDNFASGAYLYRLTVGENSLVRKMVLLK